MKDAIEPTLMQTLEETPVFVHAGAATNRQSRLSLTCVHSWPASMFATNGDWSGPS